jgi:site-specific DNA-cytosine methylase
MSRIVPLTFAEHFTGIGGIHKGLEKAGMVSQFAGEIIPSRRAILEREFPNTTIGEDVRDTPASALGRGLALFCGGFPCQDTSIAAPHRRGLDGKRSGLYYPFRELLKAYLIWVDYTGPRWVLLENTPGILKSNGGRDHAAVIGGLAELGYMGAWRVVDARGVGSPQRRPRVLYLGHLGDSPEPAWQVLGDPRASTQAHPAHPVRGQAGGLQAVGSATGNGADAIFWRKAARPRAALSKGGYETWVESDFGNVLNGFDWGNATRQTHLIKQYGRLRAPTITEWERMSGFRDDYTASMGSDNVRANALGDSFHPLKAEWLGKRIISVTRTLPMIGRR